MKRLEEPVRFSMKTSWGDDSDVKPPNVARYAISLSQFQEGSNNTITTSANSCYDLHNSRGYLKQGEILQLWAYRTTKIRCTPRNHLSVNRLCPIVEFRTKRLVRTVTCTVKKLIQCINTRHSKTQL